MPAVGEQMYGAVQELDGKAGHQWKYNPNPRTLTWERLENLRLKSLGLGSKRYSRHFSRFQRESTTMSEPAGITLISKSVHRGPAFVIVGGDSDGKKMNSIAPFYTQEKATCGFYFNRGTDNKKRKFGIPPSDLVKWRSQTN